MLVEGAPLGRPQGVFDHGVLLHRLPEAMGDLDLLEERAAPGVEHVGNGGGLAGPAGVEACTLAVACPAHGLAAHHHGDLGGSREQGRSSHR